MVSQIALSASEPLLETSLSSAQKVLSVDAEDAIQSTIITNTKYFDGVSIKGPVTIRLSMGKIQSVSSKTVPGGPPFYDAKGGILIPGLIDYHIHVPNQNITPAYNLAAAGITTSIDHGSWPDSTTYNFRALTRNPRNRLTYVLSSGVQAVSPGSAQANVPDFPKDEILGSKGQVEGFVKRRFANGMDFIKAITDQNEKGLDQDVLDTLVVTAHNYGMKVVAHAANVEAWKRSIKAKVDCITHTPLDGPLDSDILGNLTQLGIVTTPTLIMMKQTATMAQKPEAYRNAERNSNLLRTKTIAQFAGSDAAAIGNGPLPPPLAIPLESGVKQELELFVKSGMPNADALRSATDLVAHWWGLEDRGSIEIGKRADLILLQPGQDPLRDIKAIYKVAQVWLAGVDVLPSVRGENST